MHSIHAIGNFTAAVTLVAAFLQYLQHGDVDYETYATTVRLVNVLWHWFRATRAARITLWITTSVLVYVCKTVFGNAPQTEKRVWI